MLFLFVLLRGSYTCTLKWECSVTDTYTHDLHIECIVYTQTHNSHYWLTVFTTKLICSSVYEYLCLFVFHCRWRKMFVIYTLVVMAWLQAAGLMLWGWFGSEVVVEPFSLDACHYVFIHRRGFTLCVLWSSSCVAIEKISYEDTLTANKTTKRLSVCPTVQFKSTETKSVLIKWSPILINYVN